MTRAASPKEALEYMDKKGHKMALLAGGPTLLNAFLDQSEDFAIQTEAPPTDDMPPF
jgi:CO/xanthine dehydrogenase FAD-binding subunit